MDRAHVATNGSQAGHRYFALRHVLFAAPILFALVCVLNITAGQAQVIASAELVAGRSAYSDAAADVHNALRVSTRVFSLQRQGSDNTYPRRKIKIELINPSGQAVASLTAGIGHDGNQTVNGKDGTERGMGYELKAPAALGGANACGRWHVKLTDAETGAAPNPDPSSQMILGKIEFDVINSGPSSVTIQAPSKFGIVQSDKVDKTITVPFFGEMSPHQSRRGRCLLQRPMTRNVRKIHRPSLGYRL